MSPTQTVAVFFAKYVIFLLIAIAGVWFLWKVPRPLKKDVLIIGATGPLITFIISLLAAKLYFDPRPFVSGHVTPLIAHAPDNGFPSDHTLLSAAIASIVWVFNRRLGALLLALTLSIGLSRVFAGVHHLIDVLGAIVIAIGSVYLANFIVKQINAAKHS